MKTAGKWMAALLCVLLLAALPVTALAADGGTSGQDMVEDILGRLAAAAVTNEDVAAEYMSLLDEEGLIYYDEGLLSNGAYLLDIPFSHDSGTKFDLYVFINQGSGSFDIYVMELRSFGGMPALDRLRIVNDLNLRYDYVTFMLKDDTLMAGCHGILRGDAAAAAQLLQASCRRTCWVLNAALNELAVGTDVSGEAPDEQELAGKWYFSSFTSRTAQGAETTVTAELLGTDELVVLTLSEDGTAELSDPGGLIRKGAPKGTWTRRGDTVVLDLGEALTLTLEDDGTLLYDGTGKGGTLVALARRPEDASAEKNERQTAAAERAGALLRNQTYSRASMIERLTGEGYTPEEAAWGADNCGADWREQALRSGKAYLNSSSFSHDGLVHQLEYEGFTTEEATYAADTLFSGVGESGRTVGEENALREVRTFLTYIPSSYERMKAVLLSQGFSPEEAAYAMDNCGVDWAEQALLCAENYKNDYPTREKLSRRLELDGFTAEEIAYAVDRVGVE